MINEFNVKKYFAANGMIGMPDLSEVDERVDCGEESTIKPSPTLRDKFRNRI